MRSRLFFSVLLGGFILASGAALGQIASPSYANLYWEASGNDWDTDMATYALQQADAGNPAALEIAAMTRDGLDSMVESMLSSSWILDWEPYGVTSVTAKPYDFEIIPGDHSDVPACQNVTPTTDDVPSWFNNVPQFISCAVALEPALSSNDVVLNVFLPPWVTGSDGWDGFNEATDGGYSVAVMPTNAYLESNGLPEISYWLSHEITEATVGGGSGAPWSYRQIADVCEGAYYLPQQEMTFLTGDLAEYEEYGETVNFTGFDAGPDAGVVQVMRCFESDGGEVPCECVPPATSIPTMNPPTVKACGSGQYMQIQMQLDQSASLNGNPWDIPYQQVSDGGSFYFWTQVLAAPPWQAGGEHFINLPNPVLMGPLEWTSGGYIQMNGFGAGYGSNGGPNTAQPGATINLFAYDPVWGQLNSNPSGTGVPPSVTAEMPVAYADVLAVRPVGTQYQAWTVQGQLLGSPQCGLTGHVVGGVGLPIGDARVTIQGVSGDSYPANVYTAADGFFQFAYTPTKPGKKTIVFTAPGGLKADAGIIVAPEIDTITPSYGLALGGNTVNVTGQGLEGSLKFVFTYQLKDGGVVSSLPVNTTGVNDNLATFSTPYSPYPGKAPGLVAVAVYSNSGAQWSNSLPFTYMKPGVPSLSFKASGSVNCSPDDRAYVTATVIQSDGGLNPNAQVALAPVISGGVSFSPTTVANGGTSLASITVGTDAPYEFTATSGGIASDAGVPVYPMYDCKYIAFFWPFAVDGHQAEASYTLNDSTWVSPVVGDPWDWAEPQVTHLSSPYSPSSFTIQTLGLDWIWGLGSYTSPSGISAAAIPYSSHTGTNLCSTGRVLNITNTNETPDWDATVRYPVDGSINPAYYRVFGLNASSSIWVEMSSSIVTYGSGYAIQASDQTSDPHGVVEGYVNGPYALAYWSSSACPTHGP